MKAEIRLVKPEDSLATVTITATMGEFELAEKTLREGTYTMRSFAQVFAAVVRKARAEFASLSEIDP